MSEEMERLPMSEEGFEGVLKEIVESYAEPIYTDDGDTNANVKSVNTFYDNGLLTRNKGLVVRLNDGSEFQITIVKSR